MSFSLIAALDRARAIGRGNALPWHLPDDLKRFKALTINQSILMGRKTFESIGRPLPQRRNLVLSKDPTFFANGVEVLHDPDEALELGPVCVIGGAEIYQLFLPFASKMQLTLVNTLVKDADAFFPSWDGLGWREVTRSHHAIDARHAHDFDWVDFERP